MDKINKFVKAVELVTLEGVFSMGLVVKDNKQKVNWNDFVKNIQKIKVADDVDVLSVIREVHNALKGKKWCLLDLRNYLPSEVYNNLRQLSLNNHLQYTDKEKVVDFKQPKETRIIVEISNDDLKIIISKYPDFKNLFGPIMNI